MKGGDWSCFSPAADTLLVGRHGTPGPRGHGSLSVYRGRSGPLRDALCARLGGHLSFLPREICVAHSAPLLCGEQVLVFAGSGTAQKQTVVITKAVSATGSARLREFVL